jgi:hypothetical protein
MTAVHPPPPGVRIDSYEDHVPLAITAQISDIGDSDRWRLFITAWRYDPTAGDWSSVAMEDGLTKAEVRRVFEYMSKHAPKVLP